ncbi:BFR2 protein [Plectosphaerella plurivora]|uniref:Protein BFR2 n=1 Tax=Plectosphaerella plurivora TaxID=936078 RepID=A0A9P8V8S1_9PEZI|nr:BFR2 protein [Plectosphaerella plurivora]
MAVPKRFSEWEEKKAPKDYDPEADAPDAGSEDGSDSEAGADLTGTEHYASVGKSKLRQKDGVALGPQYRGAKISRDDLLNDDISEDEDEEDDLEASGSADSDAEFDDPDSADLEADTKRLANDDSEIESDDALGDSDDEKLKAFAFRGSSAPRSSKGKKRATAADFISDSEEASDNLDEDEEDSDDDGADLLDLEAEEETGDSELDEDEDDEDSAASGSEEASDDEGDIDSDDSAQSDSGPSKKKASSSDARAEQRRLMNEGQKALIENMSAAARQDAEKGLAVRQQRKVFDGLLNIRIRLQKAIVATNSFTAFEDEGEHELAPYEAAEEAALKLLETLSSVRESLLPQSSTGEKRKRETNTNEALWEELQETDARAAKFRRKVLENWSNKTKSSVVEVKSRNLGSVKQSITASLDDQLLNSDRLIKRTRTPRSCAPVQIAKKINEDEAVYDDADFYQLLLKELVDQRTSDETSARAGNASVATVRWAAMKEARTKKHVDRRASKGRKMRFNVHEKLQNFMAPEDRRGWEQEAIDRLFGTLFGQKMELNEIAAAAASDDDMDDGEAEAAGLRLFRS